jgi:hypothetical protein
MNNIITTQQDHLPSTPMPLADFTVQLMRDSDRLEMAQGHFFGVAHQRYDNPDERISALTQALEDFGHFYENELPVIISNLERASDQKAASEHIAGAVAVLLHSFPNVKDNFDSTVFISANNSIPRGMADRRRCPGSGIPAHHSKSQMVAQHL